MADSRSCGFTSSLSSLSGCRNLSLSLHQRLGWRGRGGLADPLLRASGEHSIHLGPEPMNLECATREHGGLAWPPRLSAIRQPRRVFSDNFPSRWETCPAPLLLYSSSALAARPLSGAHRAS